MSGRVKHELGALNDARAHRRGYQIAGLPEGTTLPGGRGKMRGALRQEGRRDRARLARARTRALRAALRRGMRQPIVVHATMGYRREVHVDVYDHATFIDGSPLLLTFGEHWRATPDDDDLPW